MITAGDKLRMKAKRELLKKQIKIKFNNLDDKTISLVDKADLQKIEELSEKILIVDSEEEFIDFIKQ